MTNEELKEQFTALSSGSTFDETGEWLNVMVPPSDFRKVMKGLRHGAGVECDFLFCLTCVDWKTHFTMVYHLISKKHRHVMVVKVKLESNTEPTIPTISDIWKTAIFHEREVYDLFGVNFTDHPDLRRLLLDDEWVGHPLRKNYVDENMIAL